MASPRYTVDQLGLYYLESQSSTVFTVNQGQQNMRGVLEQLSLPPAMGHNELIARLRPLVSLLKEVLKKVNSQRQQMDIPPLKPEKFLVAALDEEGRVLAYVTAAGQAYLYRPNEGPQPKALGRLAPHWSEKY